MSNRLANLRARLAAEHLDGLLITRPENQLYISGFPGGEYLDATVLVSQDVAMVSTDSRYYEDVKQRAKGFALFEAGYDRNLSLGEFAKQAKPKIVGFEMSHLTVATLKDWSKAARKAGFKLKPVTGLVEDLRIVKDEDELAKIRRAVDITAQPIPGGGVVRTGVRPVQTTRVRPGRRVARPVPEIQSRHRRRQCRACA